MASAPGHGHTAYGAFSARRAIEDDHASGHVDGSGVQHVSVSCSLCVTDAVNAKAQQLDGIAYPGDARKGR